MPDPIPYEELCSAAMEVVREAAAYIREQHENRKGITIEEKGKQNFVTQVDKKAEEIKTEQKPVMVHNQNAHLPVQLLRLN